MACKSRLERIGLRCRSRAIIAVAIVTVVADVAVLAQGVPLLLMLRRAIGIGDNDGNCSWLDIFYLPDLGGVIGATGSELFHVRREEDAGDVLLVGAEVGHGEKLGTIVGLKELPDKNVSLKQLAS